MVKKGSPQKKLRIHRRQTTLNPCKNDFHTGEEEAEVSERENS